MSRRERTDSLEFQAKVAKRAFSGIAPPLPLRDIELQFWKVVTAARHEWTDIDLIHAVNLCRALAGIEEETELLMDEGSVVKNERGTMVMNPRHTVLEQLNRRAVNLSGKLHIHAAATMGEVSANRKKNKILRDKAGEFSHLENNDLIARPNY